MRYGVFDGVPGDPDDPSATAVQFNGRDGLLHALEFNHTLPQGARLGVGGFWYTTDFATLDQSGAMGVPIRKDGNSGVYVFADAKVFEDNRGRRMTAFVRYGVADDELNALDSYLGLGAAITAPFPGRPDDQLGLAIASARSGANFRALNGVDAHETTIEITYSAQLNDWLRIQPDFQYVINPGADPTLKDSIIFGLRFEIATGFGFNPSP